MPITDYYLPLGLVDANGVIESDASVVASWIDANVPDGADIDNWNRVNLCPQALGSAIYLLKEILELRGRRYLIIEAQGVTIRRDTTPTTRDHPIVSLIGCRDVYWHKGRIIGDAVNPTSDPIHETDGAFQFRQCKDIQVSHVAISDNTGQSRGVWGDFFWLYTGQTGDPATGGISGTNERIWIHDCSCNRCGRQGVAVERVVNCVVERISLDNVEHALVDIEPSGASWRCEDLHVYDVTASGGAVGFYSIACSRNDRPNIHRVNAARWSIAGRIAGVKKGGLTSVPRSSTWILEDIVSTYAGETTSNPPRFEFINVDNVKVRRCGYVKATGGNGNHPEACSFVACTNVNAPDFGQTNGNDFRPQTTARQIMNFATVHPSNGVANHEAADVAFGTYVDFTLPRPNVEGRAGGSWGQPPAAVVNVKPDPPTNIVATAGNNQVAVAWDPSDETDHSFYRLSRSANGTTGWTLIADNLTSPSYTDIGRTNGTTYYYRATDVDTGALESDPSSVVNATPQNTLTPPSNVAVIADVQKLTVTWDARPLAESVASTKVYRSANGTTGWTLVATVPVPQTQWVDSPQAVQQWYRLTSFDTDGDESTVSSVVHATPLTLLAPTALLFQLGRSRLGGVDRFGGVTPLRLFDRTDTLTAGVVDNAAVLVPLARTDTLIGSVAEARTAAVTLNRADTLVGSIADATTTAAVTLNRTDVLLGAVAGTVTSAVSTADRTDTLIGSVDDVSSITESVVDITTSDTLTGSISDSAVAPLVAIDTGDILTTAIVDASSLLVQRTVIDDLETMVSESVTASASADTNDMLTVAVDDQVVTDGAPSMLDLTDELDVFLLDLAFVREPIVRVLPGDTVDLIYER